MTATSAFLTDLFLTGIVCVATMVYLSSHLRALLVELCGTQDRARFWLAVSNVTLILVPLVFALDYTPDLGPGKTLVFEMAAQIKWALIGFVATLGMLAIILFSFVRSANPRARTESGSGE